MSFGLSDDLIKKLKAFFSKYENIEKVVIFGSRARGDNAAKSDIDFCVYAPTMSKREFSRFKLSLDDLPILYHIDVVHFECIDEKLKANILRDEKLFFEKKVI